VWCFVTCLRASFTFFYVQVIIFYLSQDYIAQASSLSQFRSIIDVIVVESYAPLVKLADLPIQLDIVTVSKMYFRINGILAMAILVIIRPLSMMIRGQVCIYRKSNMSIT
jgi:hypothetical protein